MSATIDTDGCFIWEGNVGCSDSNIPVLSNLRVGKISYSPHTCTFIIYIGRGKNERQETSFSLSEVSNISLYGAKHTACSFHLIQLDDIRESTLVVIDFKGARNPNNLLTPTEKAQSFCEFLLRLTSEAKATTLYSSNNESSSSTPLLLIKKRKKKGFPKDTIINLSLSIDDNKSTHRSKRLNEDDNDLLSKYARFDDEQAGVSSLYDSLRSKSSISSMNFGHTRGLRSNNNSYPSGLANMGNTCYVNSVLQATFVIDALSKRLVDALMFFEKESLNSTIFIERHLPLMKALSNLMHNRIGNNVNNFLESVFECVKKAADKFRHNRQEDAHEFLTDMLSQLQSEYNEAVSHLNGKHVKMLQSSDPIRDCFGYTIRRTFTCVKCQHESTAEEESTNYIVHISEERLKSEGFTFADLLHDSMVVESVEHVCEKCKHKIAFVKPEFIQLPEHFIFVIRRYMYNHNNRTKQKLHAKVSMHKYLTFVTTSDISQSDECKIKLSKSDSGITPINGSSLKRKSKASMNNQWKDKKINTPTVGYLIDDVDEETHLKNNFEKLIKKCDNFKNGSNVIPCKAIADTQSESFERLALVLTGGSEALYSKLKEMIYTEFLKNSDIFSKLLKKSEKTFRSYVKNCQKTEAPMTNLALYGLSAIFQTVLVVFEDDKWISYSPKYTINNNGERKLVKGRSNILRNKFFLPLNINCILSEIHPKRSKSYCLSSVVCHVGQTAEGGHYKCAVYSSGGQWSMCNDDVVNNCHEKTVLEKSGDSGYILIYTSCKDRSISPKRE